MTKKLISFCIPVRNESENLYRLFSTLEAFAEAETNYTFEFFFTDNSSQDSTWQIIKDKSVIDDRYKGIRFTNNIGFNNSILANLLNARGDALIQYDADLQDPIEVVGEFLRSWESGFKVVVGVRTKRSESFLISALRKIGYRILRKASNNTLSLNVGDFKLLDREIVEHLRVIRNPEPYLRGIIAEMNFPTANISYTRYPRIQGKSKFNFLTLLSFGFGALIEHSRITLKVLWVIFFLFTFLIMNLIGFYIWQALHSSNWPQGFLTLYILQLMNIVFILFSTSITLTLIIRMYSILSGTPRFLTLDRTHNLSRE